MKMKGGWIAKYARNLQGKVETVDYIAEIALHLNGNREEKESCVT